MSSQASDETPTGSSNASQISKLSASPSPSEVATPTVLVVGGGVCGLVTGLALIGAGCEVHIYEQYDVQSASASGDIAFLVTDELQQFLKSCDVPLYGKSFRTSGRQVLAPDGDAQLRDSTEQEYISWNTLHSALLAVFPADHYHSHSRVVAVDHSHQDFVIIELSNGERIAGHMLVAADGMGSCVRAELLPNCQPSYSGYLAWRGICHLDRLSEGVQHLLADRGSMFKGPNLHVLVHPLAGCDGIGEGQPLAWTWFNNQLEEELAGLLLDEQLTGYAHAVPLGKLSSAVMDAVAAAAADGLPEPLAELISCSVGSMSVTAVSDMALPCLTRANRVAFVGESGCVVRPHGCSNLQKALMDAVSLADCLRARKLGVEKALAAWEDQQVKQSIALCKAAAAAGNRLQGTEEC